MSTKDNSAFNRAAEACSSHRMRQVSYEAIYATRHGHGDPVADVYTYRCSGSCQQTLVIGTKP